jgi:hypothetical protein
MKSRYLIGHVGIVDHIDHGAVHRFYFPNVNCIFLLFGLFAPGVIL